MANSAINYYLLRERKSESINFILAQYDDTRAENSAHLKAL
jgi:hypothetical protein